MIVHDVGAGHRIGIALVNTLSFGVASLLIVLVSRRVLGLFALVTLGPRVAGTPLEALLPAEVGWFNGAVAAALLVGAAVLIAATDRVTQVAWSYKTALAPLPAVALVGVVALSYRFLGLLMALVILGIYARHPLGHRRLRAIILLCLVLLGVSLAPADVSLQNVPGGAHFALGSSGLLSKSGIEMAERGEIVILGGCSPAYYEPRWVLVW
jgi:hypothetical protein